MHQALTHSARWLAARIRDRELSPVEVVDAHIDRITRVDPLVNAMVAERFDAARAEARRAEARVLRTPPDELPPLLGVPCTIKEFLGVRGLPQTGGIHHRSTAIAEHDATVVRRLKRAGAIVLGGTNAPEGGLWFETNNPLHGRTHNPHDLWRTPGGSSGGEGAIIAAGGSPLGIGSDTGGSIRIPAGFCGVVGHKPTQGLVPTSGHFPHPPPTTDLTAVGPLLRSAEDLWTVLGVLAGPDGIDRRARRIPLGDPTTVDWSTVRVMPLPDNGTASVRPEVRSAVFRAAQALAARGARIVPYAGPDLSRAFELWAAALSTSGETYEALLRPPGVVGSLLREVAGWPVGRSRHAGGVLALLVLERLLGQLPGPVDELAHEAAGLPDRFDRAIGDALVLHPVYPRAAPRHRGMVLRDPRDVACTTAFNLTGSPVTVVPADVDRHGLPIGVQIVGRRGDDHRTIAAAVALEQALGGPRVVDPRRGRSSPTGLRLA